MATPRSKPPTSSLVFLIAVSVFAFFVTPSPYWRILYAALAGYSLLSIVFRFGWLVPCTIIGTHIGLLWDQPIGGIWASDHYGVVVDLDVGMESSPG